MNQAQHPSSSMVFLLADLARDPALQARLAQDPDAVLDQYNIAESDRRRLATSNQDTVIPQLHAGTASLMHVAMPMPWPSNGVELSSVSPTKVPAHQLSTLTLSGQNFLDGATVFLADPHHNIAATITSLNLTTITCTVTLPSGTFNVTVTNPGTPNTNSHATLTSAVTAS